MNVNEKSRAVTKESNFYLGRFCEQVVLRTKKGAKNRIRINDKASVYRA